MLTKPDARERCGDEGGFTLIELMVVCLVMAIVLSIAGDALLSLTTASNRNSSVLGEEQTTSVAMTQLTTDIRDATGITFPTGVSPSTEVELNENSSSASGSEILWVYNSTAGTLTREKQVNGTWTNAGFQLGDVTNTSSQAVFTYYDSTAASVPVGATVPLPGTVSDQDSLEVNATAIGIDLYVTGSISGTPTYHFSNEVTMTNVLNATEPAGEGV